MKPPARRVENHDCRLEGGAILCAHEFESAFQYAGLDIRFVVNVGVPIHRARTDGDEHHHRGSLLYSFACLLDPFVCYSIAIRRVAKHCAIPELAQSVLLSCVVSLAFRIGGIGGRINVEVELRIQRFEQVLRSRPVVLCVIAAAAPCRAVTGLG